jgi:hypothetical protein
LETWKLSSQNALMTGSHFHYPTETYEAHRRFFRDIHSCIEKLPTAKFVKQIQNSQISSSPEDHGMAPEILLRLDSGSPNAIEKQFLPCGKL